MGSQCFCNASIKIKRRRCRIVKHRLCTVRDPHHLCNKLLHICRAGPGGSLIGHRCQPLHQVGFKKTGQCHQHEADGTISSRIGFDSSSQSIIYHVTIDGIQYYACVVGHPQCRCRIDPITGPAGPANFLIDFCRIVAPLASDYRIHPGQCFQVESVFQNRFPFSNVRPSTSDV